MSERRIGGPHWAFQDNRYALRGSETELPNPGHFRSFQEKIYVESKPGVWVLAEGSQLRKARTILFEATKKVFKVLS